MDGLADQLQDPGTAATGLDSACRDLLSLLERHNMKEEPVIYSHLDAELDDDEQLRVRELLQTGALPAGWVCQDA